MNTFILNAKKKEEATLFLNSWASCFLEIEKKYYIKITEVSNRDFNFLKLIGQSIYFINSFNSLIISSIEEHTSFIGNNKPLDTINALNASARYIRFFNSLIASKTKFFFFREVPIRNTNNPFLKIDLQILKTGFELINELSKKDFDMDVLKVQICKHFYLQTLLYAFMFHSEKEKGIFLRFDYDKNNFINISSNIRQLFLLAGCESDIRFIGSYIIAIIANNYIENGGKYDYGGNFNVKNIKIKKPECYNLLFSTLAQNEKIKIEPLTYHLGDILWKIDGMIHDDDEYADENDKINHDKDIVKILQCFVSKYLDAVERMYGFGKIDYTELFEIETNFFNKVYPVVFNHPPVDDILSKFSKIKRLCNNELFKGGLSILDLKQDDPVSLIHIFNKLRNSNVRDYKIEALIETLDKKDLLSLLSCYSYMIPRSDIVDNKTEFLGFYKSGVFLGHIINILNSSTKPIWLFKSKPYVATNPIHQDKNNNSFNKIIVFDECFKTGFTYSLYESYITRNLYKSYLSASLYSLFDYTYYDKLRFKDSVNFHSLIKLNDINFPINYDEYDQLSKNINIYNDVEFKIINNNITDKLVDIIKYKDNDSEKMDLTFFLADTKVLFSICSLFANKILNMVNGLKSNTIFISTASSDGEILTIVTAFLIKLKNIDDIKIKFGIDKNNCEDAVNVAIDLSFVSGFSLGYITGVETNHYFEVDKIDDYFNFYDLICTIFSPTIRRDNLYSLYPI